MKKIPNILTVSRIIAVPILVILYMRKLWGASLFLFCIASLTDTLDGNIARKYGAVSNFGKIMDPLADKILTYSVFVLWVEQGISFFPGWFLIIVLFREFLVAGLRMVAAAQGKVIAADAAGKIKTLLQMFAIIFVFLGWTFESRFMEISGMYLVYASMIMTVLSGALYVINNKEVFKG